MDRKDRIIQAYNYLRNHGYIHTQKDMAIALGSTEPNISRMLKGDPKALTDRICNRIQRAFHIISADWLIDETGDMVLPDPEQPQSTPDYSSLVNAALAAKDETIEELRTKLANAEESAATALVEKETIIAAKDAQIADKQNLIDSLQEQLSVFRQQLSMYQSKNTIDDYPFGMGVADEGDIQITKVENK